MINKKSPSAASPPIKLIFSFDSSSNSLAQISGLVFIRSLPLDFEIKYFPLISVITLSPIVLINWVTPNINDLIWIIGIGLFTQAGQTFLTIGLKKLPTSEAARINYLQVLFGSLWGILFFNELINLNFIIGSLLVLLGTIISTSKILKKI